MVEGEHEVGGLPRAVEARPLDPVNLAAALGARVVEVDSGAVPEQLVPLVVKVLTKFHGIHHLSSPLLPAPLGVGELVLVHPTHGEE